MPSDKLGEKPFAFMVMLYMALIIRFVDNNLLFSAPCSFTGLLYPSLIISSVADTLLFPNSNISMYELEFLPRKREFVLDGV